MHRRSLIITLAVVSACSQRSPWVMVSPAPATSARAPSSTVATTGTAGRDDSTAAAHIGLLSFPVSGVESTRLDDSFDQPRDGGARVHRAIDIMAPKGSAILSVQDGRILRLSKSEKGGITIYATDLDEQFVYYYAHLDRYHPNIYAGKPLLRGDTLGYVGTTGNAPKNLPHLHFQVMRMPADKRFWSGEPINPYPLLRATVSAAGQ
jgi:peptidoglycan LD-endopeptidase LytH